jgi:C-terminal processing protease CtpA/Prc
MKNHPFQSLITLVAISVGILACKISLFSAKNTPTAGITQAKPTAEKIATSTPSIAPKATSTPSIAPKASPTPVPLPEASSTPVPLPKASPTLVLESGVKIITGKVTYTNSFFTAGVAEPEIILEDQGGFITRDRNFLIPIQSQVIGQITSDFYTSPFSYSLTLPAEPNGTLHDVNHDNKVDTGVMVFAVAYWTNTWGDPYLERRDQGGGGWSTAYASTKISDNRDTYLEVYGGKYLVYAPDDQQQFPSTFGLDKKLFTNDDSEMSIPVGWSVVDLDQTPFAIISSENPTIDLYEPESAALDDFSKLSYTEAFDKMVDKFKKEYAWTELKKIDWDAKSNEFRPRFEEAEKNKDAHAYALALRDFIWSIPDTHVGVSMDLLNDDFMAETEGGLGFAMRETDDGRMIANFILTGGPAEKAGMKWGAEIIALDGKPTSDVVSATVPWSSPFSNPVVKRLQQLRYALRFKMDKGTVEVKFKNPGGSEKTAKLAVVAERDSFSYSSFFAGQSLTALPVEFSVLPSGYGYIKVNSFLDNDVLSIQVWERAIRYFKDNQVPGVILDMRINGGGNGWLADQMAAYFFNTETVVGNTAYYNKGSGEFYMDPGDEAVMYPPQPDLQFDGPVAVLVGPACASACEFFSYAMTINDRALIVGQYPTEGAGGSVEEFLMPENTYAQITIGRAVDAQGNIHLEGKGVTPTVKVPVTLDILRQQADGVDVVLAAAEEAISKPQGAGTIPSAPPKVGDAAAVNDALTKNDQQLEQLAHEQYSAEDLAQMDRTFTYTIALNKSADLLWVWGWCAKDQNTLEQNLKNIQLAFSLAENDVPLDQFQKLDYDASGQVCTAYITVLSDWQAGENHLSTTVTFTARINDGMADYPAGKQVFDYVVYVKP